MLKGIKVVSKLSKGENKIELNTLEQIPNIDYNVLANLLNAMDNDLVSSITLKELHEKTGLSITTVSKKLKQLEQTGIISVETLTFSHKGQARKKNIYTFNIEIEVLDKQTVYTSKDVITYFCQKFKEVFEIKYVPNWKRDGSMIKNTLLKKYSREDIEQTLDYIIEHYNIWQTPSYPYPKIGGICSFIFNDAYIRVQSEVKRVESCLTEEEQLAKDKAICDAITDF